MRIPLTLRILVALARQGRLRMSYVGIGLAGAVYRVTWPVSATRRGVLACAAAGRVPLEDLTRIHAPGPGGREALQAWLQLGVQPRHLAGNPSGYSLRGFLARRLGEPTHDAFPGSAR